MTVGKVRVSYAAGRKVTDDEFGSFDFHVSISADITDGTSASLGHIDSFIHVLAARVEDVLAAKVKQVEDRSLPYDKRSPYGNSDYDPALEGE